ncbi:hypothetical protein HFP89_02055 [Wenzhouxiangella sp. XN79A]|uniref:hypothetical protein n=1 Tax=Wenzhouxiangella sp. XN79A TaxID=2724193 RepID=UPI00144AAF3A|nr:hypothetical protein [Wenzhouxiangella sp. XN79A]NKI33948.1 hypothetical protein [Wenzhouxiangella sp. XN79A]
MDRSLLGLIVAIVLVTIPAGLYAWRTLRSLDEKEPAAEDRFETGLWLGAGAALAWFLALQLTLGIAFR